MQISARILFYEEYFITSWIMYKGIIGVSGEYYVAAELSQMGIVATLTLKNTPKVDILATNLSTGKFANIQVKTMAIDNNAGWRLSDKDEELSTIRNHFYVMVNLLWPGKLPEYIIIPQSDLAEFLRKDHEEHMSKPWRWGKLHKDTPMRVLDPKRRKKCEDFVSKYRNNWEILWLFE